MNAKPSIHLDNAAASVPDALALTSFCEAVKRFFANQEGSGQSSLAAASAVAVASKELFEALTGVAASDVHWANTGTDALTAAVEAATTLKQGTILSTAIEHPALAEALERAATAQGRKVLNIPVAPDGQLDLFQLEKAIDETTALVALHHVHAETGAIQNLEAIRGLLDKKASKAFLLVDATQSVLKLPLPWQQAKIDFATLSGAKIGVPCGAALLFREDERRRIAKRLRAIRSIEHKTGRCPAAACVTLGATVKRLSATLPQRLERMKAIKEAFQTELKKALGDRVGFTVPNALASPYILHLLIDGVQGATIVRMLSDKGFSVAAGSACDAEARTPSKALLAMGIPRVEAYSALRLSFWTGDEDQHAKAFAEALAQAVKDY